MRSSGWGRFVAITSIAVREPLKGLVLSNAIRAAVTGYLKSISDEVAADGVTVNSVCPGFTATDRLGVLAKNVAEREGVTVDEVYAGWAETAPSIACCAPMKWRRRLVFCARRVPPASPELRCR